MHFTGSRRPRLASVSASGDSIVVELITPDGMPPAVRITWPTTTVVQPARYADTASAIMRVIARANVGLTRIRARR
jgi:hypothetical protein